MQMTERKTELLGDGGGIMRLVVQLLYCLHSLLPVMQKPALFVWEIDLGYQRSWVVLLIKISSNSLKHPQKPVSHSINRDLRSHPRKQIWPWPPERSEVQRRRRTVYILPLCVCACVGGFCLICSTRRNLAVTKRRPGVNWPGEPKAVDLNDTAAHGHFSRSYVKYELWAVNVICIMSHVFNNPTK